MKFSYNTFLLISGIIIFLSGSYLLIKLNNLSDSPIKIEDIFSFKSKNSNQLEYPIDKEFFQNNVKISTDKSKYSIDIPEKTQIFAVADGVVNYANFPLKDYPNLVNIMIKRDDGKTVAYNFFGNPQVQKNQKVKKGEPIGIVIDAEGKKVYGGVRNAEIMLIGPDGSEPIEFSD